MKKILLSIVVAGAFLVSCNDEFLDPTKPSQEEVLSTRSGLIGATNGLQQLWSNGRASVLYTSITANGLTTRELRVVNAGNVDEGFLEAGGTSLTANNAVAKNLWAYGMVINSEAQKILDNINVLTVENEKASVFTHASIFKAMALGTLIQFYEKVPTETSKSADFKSRADVLAKVISTLKATEPYLNTANGFTGLVPGISYKNTVNALLARYYLMLGDNDNALAYANLVNVTVKSEFRFDALTNNPIAFNSIATNNNYQPRDRNLGLPSALTPASADARINFYVTADNKALGFFDTSLKSIPLYLPGEITLIKAEVLARKNDLTGAVTELNKVLTKTASSDAFGVGANLPAYAGTLDQASILTEIYKNRCIELYMSGLRLEDSRRFNRPATERNRNWYPYPDSERFNNPNTPADPAN
ncbi:RagB/SusD family nutrient uptake outer membrane protein [Flavobacterium succinicans]|uniref:SusD family protein n=1 Tax=Flavobacterium succinicans TaxID=29536 RepID=A0A199XQF1_9FLAO|nr:RagB/SusD family nutrient uptake outer membrane protein [Flavobacterium succinicans]OAZ03870.1 SusD family protein [Flavobacterium succinicans]